MRAVFFFVLFVGLQADAKTLYLNGNKTDVFFNDGDTFKILNGPHKGTRSRVKGFNTLESYGPVHEWGAWNNKDLHGISREATEQARSGEWHCQTDFKTDRYGRILSLCQDLGVLLLELGLAHVMVVEGETPLEIFVQAQSKAIKNQTGMWSKGVPDFIVTSVHSASEFESGQAYDRLVSTQKGLSKVVSHDEFYENCERICYGASSKRLNLEDKDEKASCMTYTQLQNRFGDKRATCLVE